MAVNDCVALVFTDVEAGVTVIDVSVAVAEPLPEPPPEGFEEPGCCKPLQACRQTRGRVTRARCRRFNFTLLIRQAKFQLAVSGTRYG